MTVVAKQSPNNMVIEVLEVGTIPVTSASFTFGSRIFDEPDEKWNDEKFLNTRKNTEHLRKALKIFEEILNLKLYFLTEEN